MLSFGIDTVAQSFCHSFIALRSTTAQSTVYCWSHTTSHLFESQILVENRDFCLPHLHPEPPFRGPPRYIAIPFGAEKLEWCSYATVKKNLKIRLFISTEYAVCDSWASCFSGDVRVAILLSVTYGLESLAAEVSMCPVNRRGRLEVLVGDR